MMITNPNEVLITKVKFDSNSSRTNKSDKEIDL